MKKEGNKKSLIYELLVAAVLIVAGGIIFLHHSPVKDNSAQGGTIFADSSYYQYSYLISNLA